MKKILILHDYREQFWLTVRHRQASFIMNDLVNNFEKLGYVVTVKGFSDLDFETENYSGYYVVYQSTEDPYLLYNSYIEDILWALQDQGAILLPALKYNRAHHNKVFMELLRSLSDNSSIHKIKSRTFGTYEEYIKFSLSKQSFFPQVVKLAEGAQSKNVIKIDNVSECHRVKRLMWFPDIKFYLKDKIKAYLPKRYPEFKPQSSARRKIVVQNYIDRLNGDYKVLVFANKFYVLSRGNRPGDFRASGSGLFEFPADVNKNILEFAQKVFESFDVPFISMDLGMKDQDVYLIEFQFVAFGTYTLEKAPWHWEFIRNGNWKKISSSDNLEYVFCAAVDEYINRKFMVEPAQ